LRKHLSIDGICNKGVSGGGDGIYGAKKEGVEIESRGRKAIEGKATDVGANHNLQQDAERHGRTRSAEQ
jgi:hypothetical protein